MIAIYSKHHLLLSTLVGLAVVAATDPPVHAAAVVAYAAAVGTLVDLDHFLIERLVVGEWRGLGRGLADPRRLVVDQSELFAGEAFGELDRLLSHAVIVGITVPAAWAVDPYAGAVTALALYVHVLSDLAWDVYRLRLGGG